MAIIMYKVLIVDDEEYATANDGEEALMLVEAVKPDIVIVDVCTPGYDGITFMHKVREIN